MKESTVFTRKYCTELTNLSTLSVFEVEIWCFRGGDVVPLWIHRQAGMWDVCGNTVLVATVIPLQRISPRYV